MARSSGLTGFGRGRATPADDFRLQTAGFPDFGNTICFFFVLLCWSALDCGIAADRDLAAGRERLLRNVDRVRELVSCANGDFRVRLADGTELRLSRTRRQAMQRLARGR